MGVWNQREMRFLVADLLRKEVEEVRTSDSMYVWHDEQVLP